MNLNYTTYDVIVIGAGHAGAYRQVVVAEPELDAVLAVA